MPKSENPQPNAQALYTQGRSAQNTGDFKAALKAYKAAARADRNFRPAFVRLGELYSKAKRPDLAMGFFQRALELQADAPVLFNLGSECWRLNQMEQSRRYLKAALKLDPRLVKAHLLLAFLYRNQQEHQKAITYFQNVRKLEALNRIAWLGEAIANSELQRFAEARQLLEGYLQKSGQSDAAFTELLAGIQLQLGDSEASWKQYRNLTHTSKKFTSFTDHLQQARSAQDAAFQNSFKGLDQKIDAKLLKLKQRIKSRRELLAGNRDLSALKNGIEGAQDLQQELKQDLTDMVDLSLMHLFNGDTDKAMQFLFQAHKMGKDHQLD
ncbi:MAG: tetratricopeptide repeat protein [Leptospiraceae bacterium]|nr:tetratricopeptide repeat protein [Leptospiraceae bacterium]